jgi:O-antigen/teichoic acid export membrane protein
MQKVRKVLKSDLGKSISSGYLLFIVNNVVALFLTPYMLQFITKEEYGFYILCVDFLAWVGFLEFGTNKVIESKAAYLIAHSNYDGLNKTFNSSFFFQILVGLLIIPFYFFLITFGINKVNLSHLNIIIVIFAVSACLSVFRNLFSSVIIASKKVYLDNRIQLIINILNYIFIILLVPYVGVLGLAIINLFAIFLMLIRSNFRVKKLYPSFKIDRSFFDRIELKSLISNGIYFSVGSLATIILMKLDSFIIGREFGLEEVASFYITIKLYTLAQKIFQLFFNNFRPHIAHFYGKNEFSKIKQFYEVISPLILGVCTLLIALIMLFNHLFVKIWVGDSFFISHEFNILYGFYILLDLMTIPSRIILTASLYDLKNQSFFRILEAIGRIVGITFFIKFIGINILPISSIVGCLIFGNLFFHFQLRKYFVQKNNLKLNQSSILIQIFFTMLLFIMMNFLDLVTFSYLLASLGLFLAVYYFWKNFDSLKKMHFLIH